MTGAMPTLAVGMFFTTYMLAASLRSLSKHGTRLSHNISELTANGRSNFHREGFAND
jgi:hypothetical protein